MISNLLSKVKAVENRKVLIVLVLLLSSLTHFLFLGYPDSVVFDEVHFGNFSTAYCCTYEHIFDVHPPHAKLLIGWLAKLTGYNGGPDFSNIGNSYGDVSAVHLRLAPAISGVLLSLVVFILVGQLGGSVMASFIAALIVIFDNALTLQTRVIALDGLLVLGTFAAISLFLAADRAHSATSRILFLIASGLCTGLAVGSKFTGLVALGVPSMYALYKVLSNRSLKNFGDWVKKYLVYLVSAVAIFIFGWYLHFALLTEPGYGDIWGKPTGDFFFDMYTLQVKMITANMNLDQTHPDSSMWWGWPVMNSSVMYWAKGKASIYLIGNPIVWWVSSLLFVSVMLFAGLSKITNLTIIDEEKKNKPVLWLPIFGFFLAFGPMMAISRPLFLYHYLTPLVFSIITSILWLDYVGWIRDKGFFKQRISFYVYIVLLVTGFVLMSPFTYGHPYFAFVKDFVFKLFPWWQ